MERVVGFDFGFGNIKMADNKGNKIIFPTLDAVHFGKDMDYDQEYIVELNDEMVYDVGEFATISNNAKKWDKNQSLDKERLSLFLGTALFLLSEKAGDNEQNETEKISLGVGLPVDYYNNQKEPLEKILTNLEIKVKIRGKTKQFLICNHHIMKQAVGAFLSLCISLDGGMRTDVNQDLFHYGGGLVDIGYKTVDIVRIAKNNNRFVIVSAQSHSLDDSGIFIAHERAKNELNRKFGISHDEVYYETKMNELGFFRYGKQNIELRPYFQTEYQDLSEHIKNKIISSWKDMSDFGVLIITGGGATPTKGMFDNLNINVEIQDENVFANVNGYVAKMMMIENARNEM